MPHCYLFMFFSTFTHGLFLQKPYGFELYSLMPGKYQVRTGHLSSSYWKNCTGRTNQTLRVTSLCMKYICMRYSDDNNFLSVRQLSQMQLFPATVPQLKTMFVTTSSYIQVSKGLDFILIKKLTPFIQARQHYIPRTTIFCLIPWCIYFLSHIQNHVQKTYVFSSIKQKLH